MSYYSPSIKNMPIVARFKGNVAIRLKSNYCFLFVIMCWNIQYLYECIAIYLPPIYSFKNGFELYSGKYCIPAYSREQYGTKQCLLSFTWLSSIPPSAIWNANPGSGKRLLSKSWAYPASYSKGSRSSFPGANCQGMKVTTHLHLVLRLRMSGAIPLLHHLLS